MTDEQWRHLAEHSVAPEGDGRPPSVLSRETVEQMVALRPGVEALEFPGTGHAPVLMGDDQIAAIRGFLLR